MVIKIKLAFTKTRVESKTLATNLFFLYVKKANKQLIIFIIAIENNKANDLGMYGILRSIFRLASIAKPEPIILPNQRKANIRSSNITEKTKDRI